MGTVKRESKVRCSVCHRPFLRWVENETEQSYTLCWIAQCENKQLCWDTAKDGERVYLAQSLEGN
jgi:hypothetical protein